ncbi:MAG: hypothetical protein ACI9WC_003653 [Arenicella sp.]|jgi:hypothetical protein
MMTDEELVDKIKAGDFDRKQLENLYANALERDRDSIAEAAKAALQEVDPRSYKRKYIKPIKDKVAQIAGDIATAEGWGDWEDNAASNGIKSTGALISAEEIAESCLSYKHPSWKKASLFYVSQADEESAVRYKVTPHNSEEQVVATEEEAIALFSQAIKV